MKRNSPKTNSRQDEAASAADAVPEKVESGSLEIGSVLAAARSESGGGSGVYEWLWSRYEQLLPELSRHGVNWDAMAEQFRRFEIRAGRGMDATGTIVRQTWYRVCQNKARPKLGPGKRVVRTDAPAPSTPATAHKPIPGSSSEDDPDDDDYFPIIGGTGELLNPRKPK